MRSPVALTLSGCTVIDMSQGVSGPLCTRNLAQMGARVIKVERPGVGDLVRNFDDIVDGQSSGHVWVNSGKESACVDLTTTSGQEIVKRLLAVPNPILVHNAVPGHMERWGLDYDSLEGEFPQLIHASISAYGKSGPYADRSAIDLIIQGESGLLQLNGSPEQPARIALSICDIAAANYLTIGVLEATIHRQATGEGQEIHVSLLEAALGWSGYFPYMIWYRDQIPQRQGLYHPTIVPYGPYTASDGRYVFIAAAGSQWKRFCAAVERPELDDPRYESGAQRHELREELHEIVTTIIADRTSDEWIERFIAARVPCGIMRDLRDALNHPQLAEVEAVRTVDSSKGPIKMLGFPVHSTASEHRTEVGPPSLGEHTHQLLSQLGFDDSEIEDLEAKGVVA